MTRRRRVRPQRKPVFLGCEGRSEEAYGQLIRDFVRDEELAVHLDVVQLTPGAGDPLSRVTKAQQIIKHHDRTRTAYDLKFIFMDIDQAEGDPPRAERTNRLATNHGINIVWQRPCSLR